MIHSSLKQQIMATVAIHRCVLPTIVEFKNKFPDFDDKKVSNILKQKKKKRKLNIETKENSSEDSKPLNKKPKASSLIRVSEGSEMESEHDEEENEYENELSDEESGQSKSDEQNDDSICPSEESETDSRKDNQNNLNHGKTDFNENDDNDVVSNQESELDERTLKKNLNINRKTNKTLLLKNNKSVTKSLSENNYSSGEDNKVSNSSKKAESSKKSKIKKTTTKKVVDPFFVTSTNEEYVTSQVPTVNEDSQFSWRERDKNADSRESNKFHKNSKKWDNKEDYKTQRKFNKYDNQPYNKPMFNNFDKSHNNSNFSASNFVVGNRKERRKALHQPPIKEEKLHPSWEAKKKLSSIANFQGKKIKFD